ncbi:MAG: DNA-binding CsgD family transcriptional regulator [Verrucomicrobiales bacterium]|jgi:DNA-binding CsgD family transcriptional regulator
MGESDTRTIVRLLGNIAGSEANIPNKRKRLMDGLCDLIDADSWFWSMIGRQETGKLPTFSIVQHGGFSEHQLAGYLEVQEHPDMGKLNAPFLAEYSEKQAHLTRLRQQIDASGQFQRSEVYDRWRDIDIGPLILSFRPTSSEQTSGIAIFRRFDRELFSPRDSRIAHILLSEVAWLHDGVSPKPMQNLSPRLNTVLNLIIQGHGRKEIADQLEISIHTLNDYIKELYKRFKVHSQVELIRRFVDGDGGDLS